MKILIALGLLCAISLVLVLVLRKKTAAPSPTIKFVAHSQNQTWLVRAGDKIIQKKANAGIDSLTTWERLVYCLWVADYGMRNAGDLNTAGDLYPNFHSEGGRLAKELSLRLTHEAFSLSKQNLQRGYFGRFEGMCEEIKGAEPNGSANGTQPNRSEKDGTSSAINPRP